VKTVIPCKRERRNQASGWHLVVLICRFHVHMSQASLFCDFRPLFIKFFKKRLLIWTPFWTIFCNYSEPDFQTQKTQIIGIGALAWGGYPGHITEEGGTRRHPGGSRRPWTSWKHNVSKPLCFFSQSGGGDHFRVHGSDVTITKSAACAQDLSGVGASKAESSIRNTEDTPPEPLQQRLFGE